MISTIYIEKEVLDHPRVAAISQRFPGARRVICDRYGEIFNRKAQNFRLQKQRPALILAKKYKHFVLPAPDGYGVGGRQNFYFSHMLNCIYDCRYCFLQGMYRSAHYVVFVNYESFDEAIRATLEDAVQKQTWFFSGYDCDSLALEPVTGFMDHVLGSFPRLSNAWLELRTKSTQVRLLAERQPLENCVVAFSLSPENIAAGLEHKAPSIARRLAAMVKLQRQGWKIGLRFDPLIFHQGYEQSYSRLFASIFSRIDVSTLHSVSLGPFRLPEGFFRTIVRLYPRERLLAGPMEEHSGMVSYRRNIETAMTEFCADQLSRYIPSDIFFPCNYGE